MPLSFSCSKSRINNLKAFLGFFWLCACVFTSASSSAEDGRLSCLGHYTNLNQWPVVQFPKRVLLIPLLNKNIDSNENERWPEQPAAVLESFYRSRFQADVVWLRNIRTWEDFYFEVSRLLQNSIPFDRVILIGHGGFDGPVLKKAAIQQSLTIKDSEGTVYSAIESQPGKQQIFSLTYDIFKNQIFSTYIADYWRALIKMDPADASRQLDAMKIRLQPMDVKCFERYCSPDRLAPAKNEADRKIMLSTCQYICREPLFLLKSQEEITPKRFFLFADSLNSLAQKDGLIFLGGCNPGTTAPKNTSPEWYPGALSQSKLAGGPYNTYVHLFAAATRRVAAGPIGDSSADDIVKRIVALETNHYQHYLCIAAPPAL